MTLTKLFGVESITVFLAATGLLLGFTHFWLAGTSVLVGLFIWRKWYFHIHPLPLALGAIPMISGIWSSDPVAGTLFFCNVQMLYGLWRAPIDREKLFTTTWILLFGLGIIALFEIWLMNDHRPETLFVKDASVLGLSGMAFLNPLAGIAGSRTAVAGMFLFAAVSNRMIIWMFAGTAFLMLFAPIILNHDPVAEFRFTPEGLEQAQELRSEILTPDKIHPPWYGYGYHSYVLETGLQRPHNIYVLSWYELGVLSIPLWLLVLIAIWRYLPVRSSAVLLIIGLNTDELFARPEGLFVIFGLVLSAHVFKPNFQFLTVISDTLKGQRRAFRRSS